MTTSTSAEVFARVRARLGPSSCWATVNATSRRMIRSGPQEQLVDPSLAAQLEVEHRVPGGVLQIQQQILGEFTVEGQP